uniref:Tc1-like transposase DDE domain-containing protein n=1 Tax=Amphimedon queenslandica TaxID=400682 RepID=A0A1X7V752_AMPQE
MIAWLVYYGVEFLDDDCTKSQLFSIVQDAARRMGVTDTKNIVDKMALEAGHEVVRLPVVHCTFNLIELAWAQVKGRITTRLSTSLRVNVEVFTFKFTLTEVECLAMEGFKVVTKERWADLVEHVRDKVEDHNWQNDNLDLDERFRISEFVIHVGSESNDASSELDSASDSSICLSDAVAAIDSDEDT